MSRLAQLARAVAGLMIPAWCAPETSSGGTCGYFEFPWYTLELEVRD